MESGPSALSVIGHTLVQRPPGRCEAARATWFSPKDHAPAQVHEPRELSFQGGVLPFVVPLHRATRRPSTICCRERPFFTFIKGSNLSFYFTLSYFILFYFNFIYFFLVPIFQVELGVQGQAWWGFHVQAQSWVPFLGQQRAVQAFMAPRDEGLGVPPTGSARTP